MTTISNVRFQFPAILQKLATDNPGMIAFIDDERDTGDGFFLYLKDGYCFPDQGTHIIHADKAVELIDDFRLVKTCECQRCEAHIYAAALAGEDKQ